MIGSNEEKCMAYLVDFIRRSTDFRSIPLGTEKCKLISTLEGEQIFFFFKGSYSMKDVVLGIILNYDITVERQMGNIGIFYIFPCQAEFSAVLVRETESDRITKDVGLKIEIEVGNKPIDDNYLINSNDKEILEKLANEEPLESFLVDHIPDLQLLTIKQNVIQFRRVFKPDGESFEKIKADLDSLLRIIEVIEKKAEVAASGGK